MKTKLYILTIFAAFTFVACDLNQMPGGSTITEDQYQNMDNVTEGTVKGVYSLLYAYGGEHDYFGQRSIDLYGDLCCGDAAMNTQSYGWFTTDAYGRTYQRAAYFWTYYYNIIRNCNKGINALDKQGRPDLDFDPTTITDEQYANGFYYAELLTMRGWAYAALQRYFCKTVAEIDDIESELSVPIYTEKATLGDSILGAPRATAADVYRCVEEDLDMAIQYFEAFNQMKRSSKLETNIDVARMTLAYSYLNKGDYENALKYAQELIAKTSATILPKEDVLTNGFNNVESPNWIWGQDVTIENTTALASFFGQCDIYSYSYASAGDVKGIDANLLGEITAQGWDIRENWWGNYSRANGATRYQYAPDGKFFSAKSNELMGDRVWLSDNVFMRIETAYLIAAEAAAMATTPDNDLALEYLTKLTDQRVKEGKEGEYTIKKLEWEADANKLKEAIRYNWRVELWGEGYGLQTFRRWGQAVTLGANQFRKDQTISPTTDIMFTFIRPTSETNYNPYIRQTTELATKQ